MAEKITGQHWLYGWIDEFDISSLDRLFEVVKQPTARNRLAELASQTALQGNLSVSGIPDGAVVAGLGLDLMSSETCSDFECRSAIADGEFSNVLHYFDAVVMEGPPATIYKRSVSSFRTHDDVQSFYHRLHEDVQLLLHLRDIGLADYIIFGQRADCYCEEHRHTYARSLGLDEFLDDDRLLDLAKDMSRAGNIGVEQVGPREWSGFFRQPSFTGTTAVTIEQKTKPKKYDVALRLLRGQLDEMIFDAATAQQARIPLASLVEPKLFAGSDGGSLSVDDVALRVKVPAIQGLSTRDFIRLREAEYESFKRFQILTAEAIEETIRDSGSGKQSPEEVADIVWRKKIRPQVVALEQKIAASDRALTRKVIAGASFGTVSAAVGSITTAVAASAGLPIVTAVGAAAGAVGALPTLLPFLVKRIEEKQQFESEGTYFVWKAQTATSH